MNRQPTLGPGDERYSSCPVADKSRSWGQASLSADHTAAISLTPTRSCRHETVDGLVAFDFHAGYVEFDKAAIYR